MRIVLIHGFNVRDRGAGTVDSLAPLLRQAGHEVDTDEADYGWFGFFSVRFRKKHAIRRIVKALQNADAVVSHSNGGHYEDLALRAMRGEGSFRVVRLSPALNRRTDTASNVERCHVFFTRSDFLTWLSSLRPWHAWGQQGNKGYKGDNPRMVNHDCSDFIRGHFGWFHDENRAYVAALILRQLEEQT